MHTFNKSLLVAAAVTLTSLTSTAYAGGHGEAKSDGQVAVPAGYASWPKFVGTVDKAKAGQVREIYINDTGMQAKKGEAFPHGTVTVMEIYAAKKGADGNVTTSTDGRLVKGGLKKIFVMAKGKGWGQNLPAGNVDNGEWVYSAYMADGKTKAAKSYEACRACHAPLAEQDFVARYDEHFDFKK
ncbi:MAG: cytochrome P460 family protein [Gammaproteobacteria bacterium]